MAYTQQIETVPGVDKVAYFNWFGGYFQDPKNQVQSYTMDATRTVRGLQGVEDAAGAARGHEAHA